MNRILCGAALLAFSLAAAAEAPSYSYIQAGYVEIDLDNSFGDIDGNGFTAGGSVPLSDQWHVFAGYSSSDFDFNVDIDEFTIGGGWHRAITGRTDFVAELGYVRADASTNGFSIDDNGLAAGVGVRSMLRDNLELFGSINHVELDEAGGGTSVGGGLWYIVSGNLALGLAAEFDDDATAYGAGIRLYFDR
jgi:hypothetical protein